MLLLPFALAACRGRASAPATLECGEAIAGSGALLRPGATILIGDLHGTEELPRALGDLACSAARAGLVVDIGIEMPNEEQPRVDAFLRSDGAERARTDFLQSPLFWNVPPSQNDGRASQALLELFDRVRRLSRAGVPIHAFGFNDRGVDYDVGMARTIERTRAASPSTLLLLYAGNNHTRLDEGYPMGAHLVNAGLEVVSLDFRIANGSAWTCTDSCKPHPFDGQQLGSRRFISRTSRGAFDGFLYVGPIHASLPAILPR